MELQCSNTSLVVHGRGVNNFMGMILVAQLSCIFYAFFSKNSFRLWPFSNPTVENEISIRKDEMNRGIHCKSGTSIMGLAVNAGISTSNHANEERQKIPHSRC